MNATNHNKFTSAFAVAGTFSLLALFLFSIDLVPERQKVVAKTATGTTVEQEIMTRDTAPKEIPVSIPLRVQISAIGIDTAVITPSSTDIEVLDRALLSGAVHYPDSPLAGERGNMLIFGHSSYLPVVQNKAFQAFNELGKLKPGELIVVASETERYEYVVKSVRLARAQETVIDFYSETPTLTLATCNTFGEKQERWVVTAHLSLHTAL